jgi:hypothetical protein
MRIESAPIYAICGPKSFFASSAISVVKPVPAESGRSSGQHYRCSSVFIGGQMALFFPLRPLCSLWLFYLFATEPVRTRMRPPSLGFYSLGSNLLLSMTI